MYRRWEYGIINGEVGSTFPWGVITDTSDGIRKRHDGYQEEAARHTRGEERCTRRADDPC